MGHRKWENETTGNWRTEQNVFAEVPGVNKHLHVTLKRTERRWIACTVCSAKIICISLSSRKCYRFTAYLFLKGHLIYCLKSSEITLLPKERALAATSTSAATVGAERFYSWASASAKPKAGALQELINTVP